MFSNGRRGYPPKRPGRAVKSRKGGAYQAGYEAAMRDLKARGQVSERSGSRGGRRRSGGGGSRFGDGEGFGRGGPMRIGHRM